jgi:protoheme IX farnesyltransferase
LATVTNDVAPALLLFLIIFVWTPLHFWSLALYRCDDYVRACLPMLLVTHGPRHATADRALHAGAVRRVACPTPEQRRPYLLWRCLAQRLVFTWLLPGYSDARRAMFRFRSSLAERLVPLLDHLAPVAYGWRRRRRSDVLR